MTGGETAYKFTALGYSNSQLKKHSLWMIVEDPTKGLEVKAMWTDLGQFSEETNPLKRFSRVGMCLSTTKKIEGLEVDAAQVRDVIPDIKTPDGTFNFTDGSGFISQELMDIVRKEYGLDECAAIQVRVGGAKGVLHLNPFLEGKIIQLREGMKKFAVTPTTSTVDIEVIRCATFSQGHLNR